MTEGLQLNAAERDLLQRARAAMTGLFGIEEGDRLTDRMGEAMAASKAGAVEAAMGVSLRLSKKLLALGVSESDEPAVIGAALAAALGFTCAAYAQGGEEMLKDTLKLAEVAYADAIKRMK